MLSFTENYAAQPTRRGPVFLEADVFLPEGDGPFDLLVWLHAGDFRSGSRRADPHPLMANAFVEHGVAVAFLDYRLARPPAVLRPETSQHLEPLLADALAAGEQPAEHYLGARALAVVEDTCDFLQFAEARRSDWKLSGVFLLGGSSAGAVSALNVLWLPSVLCLRRPDIATVLCCSGGFGYPSYRRPTGARVLAIHSPADTLLPVSSVRRLVSSSAAGDDPVLLIEHDDYVQGDLRITPDEALSDAARRAVAFHRCDSAFGSLLSTPGLVMRASC